MSEQTVLRFFQTVRDCLGRERQPDRVWPDGSYNCPFCWSAAKPEGCANPMCFARISPPFPVERAREIVAAEEVKAKEAADRETHRAWQTAYAEEKRFERERTAN